MLHNMISNDDILIKVENLKKLYRLGLQEDQHGTIAEAVMSWIKSPLKNFKKLKGLSSIKDESDRDVLIALKDINFELKRGEILGVVGKNGAGKSTLLKLISRITKPTEGEITINGRVASLLEVGTGFHPELTGRENVYLNGTILGMKKKEIDEKLDEIIEFSGVERFLDTPVKRYSSGMTVRLAFAVAAHLDPEILIIDEVLAVGDVEFQRKCLGKMGDVSRSGKTVLFVSHNMGAVAELCTRAILLEKGELVFKGSTTDVIQRYLEGQDYSEFGVDSSLLEVNKSAVCNLTAVQMVNAEGKEKYQFDLKETFVLEFEYEIQSDISSFDNAVVFKRNGIAVFNSFDVDQIDIEDRNAGKYKIRFKVPAFFIKEGLWSVTLVFRNTLDGSHYQNYENIVRFEMQSLMISTANKGYHIDRAGEVIFPGQWELNRM